MNPSRFPKVRLKEIAEVLAGYPFRTRVRHDPKGEIAVIQLRNVDDFYRLREEDLARVSGISVKEEYFLKAGDVLVAAKGGRYSATLIEQEMPKTLAVAHFFVARPKGEGVLSSYLGWYINQGPAQQFLEGRAQGTLTRSISRRALERLPVPMPPVEVQEKVVRVHALAIREEELVEAVRSRRRQLIEAVLLKNIE